MTLKDLLPPIIHGLTAPLQQASRANFHLDPAASYQYHREHFGRYISTPGFDRNKHVSYKCEPDCINYIGYQCASPEYPLLNRNNAAVDKFRYRVVIWQGIFTRPRDLDELVF